MYLFGITDKYPGFKLDTKGLFELDITKPEKPNRWLAIPLLGIFIRFILLIPYLIFRDVLDRGAGVAMFLSWFVILFKGRLPETFYEFERDSIRVSLASSMYMLGLSDKYPSFYISMTHQAAKIGLIIVGSMLSVFNMAGSAMPDDQKTYESDGYQYDYTPSNLDINVEEDYKTY